MRANSIPDNCFVQKLKLDGEEVSPDDFEGNFKIANLRPGKYKLFAWEEVDDDQWQDPEFLQKHDTRAAVVQVGPSQTQNTQLRAIAAEAMR